MKITKQQRNLLIALAIGDGYVSKHGTICVFHSSKQKEYVEHKFNLVRHLCTHSELLTRQVYTGDTQYGFTCKVTKFTKMLRKILYPNGVKKITRKLLNRLDASHLALWWMDDGHCHNEIYENTGNLRASISTLSTCISKEDNQIIIDWILETFGVKFGQRKMKNHYALVCRTREGRKLRNVIGNFVIPSLKYKLSQ